MFAIVLPVTAFFHSADQKKKKKKKSRLIPKIHLVGLVITPDAEYHLPQHLASSVRS